MFRGRSLIIAVLVKAMVVVILYSTILDEQLVAVIIHLMDNRHIGNLK